MHATTGADTTHPTCAETTHPRYCDPARCVHLGPTVHHRSAPEIFFPRQNDTTDATMVWFSIERLDEVDESTGTQVEHPAEVVVDHGDGRRGRWGIDDLRGLVDRVFATYDQGAEHQLAAS